MYYLKILKEQIKINKIFPKYQHLKIQAYSSKKFKNIVFH